MTELIPLFVFIAWFIFSVLYIPLYKRHQIDNSANKQSWWNNEYIFESIPPVFPTLGILGTAWSIAIGLQDFDTNEIQHSIPTLLSGLKSAFNYTIAGIFFLIVFQKWVAIVQKQIDDAPNKPKKQTDELSAISELTFAVNEMKKDNATQIANLIQSFSNDLSELKKDNTLQVEKLIHSFGKDLENKVTIKLSSLELQGLTTIEQLKSLRKEQEATSKKANENTDEIIKAMGENNKLVAQKFDEFSVLLQKNNTEALVKVMEDTTKQFNAQMSELINRLVKENFAELNNSVKNLNDWQKENKAQIQQLTEQFQKTTELFNVSAITLKEVTENTKSLVDDESKLSQIVQALNKVMIDDNKFADITNKLISTIETLEKTTDSFDETTSKLNDWVRTEKNFKEAAEILITKLEEFKDLNGDVWNKYRKEMSDAVSIVKKANVDLKDGLGEINAEFYSRLNDTLQNLDQCIQRFITPNNRN